MNKWIEDIPTCVYWFLMYICLLTLFFIWTPKDSVIKSDTIIMESLK